MTADEIVRVLRLVCRGEKVDPITFEVIYAAADMIESLQSQLAESRRRERAAVDDLDSIGKKGLCSVCMYRERELSDTVCADCKGTPHVITDNFEWRGLQDAGEGCESE